MTEPDPVDDSAVSSSSLPARWVGWGVLVTLGALYVWGARLPDWFAGDEAYYVGLAQSLASGEGFTFNGQPHAIYPPGFPMLLAPAVAWLGLQPRALTLFVVCANLASLGAIAAYLRSRGDARATLPVLVFFLGSVAVFDVYTDLRSEGLFVLIAMVVLAAFERLERAPAPLALVIGLGLAAGVALPAVRSIGVAFPAAAAAAIGVRWLRRSAAPRRWTVAAGASVVGGLAYQVWWSARGALHAEERSYGNLLTMVDPHQPDLGRAGVVDVGVRIAEQLTVQVGHGVELLAGLPFHAFLFGVPQVAFVAALGFGLIGEFRRSNPLAAWFLVAYLGIVVLWPFDEGTRFLLPVFPLIVLFAFRGGAALLARPPVTAVGWRRVGAGALVFAAAAAVEVALRSPGSRQGWAWVVMWLLLSAIGFLCARRGRVSPVRFRAAPAPTPASARVVWALVALHLVVGTPGILDRAARHRAGDQQFNSRQIAGAIPWIRQHSDATAIVAATAGGQGLHLHTARFVELMPTTGDATRLWRTLDDSGARFLVVPVAHEYPYLLPTGPERLEIMDRARPNRLELVHTYDMGRIFEVRSP